MIKVQKINYQKILEDNLCKIKLDNNKPKLLLHSCCGPCSTYVIEYLMDYFEITVFYYNPNIFPEKEYELRKQEQVRYLDDLKNKGSSIYFKDIGYDKESFKSVIMGREDQKEGQERCTKCFEIKT